MSSSGTKMEALWTSTSSISEPLKMSQNSFKVSKTQTSGNKKTLHCKMMICFFKSAKEVIKLLTTRYYGVSAYYLLKVMSILFIIRSPDAGYCHLETLPKEMLTECRDKCLRKGIQQQARVPRDNITVFHNVSLKVL